jgi:hypothetical protein
MEFGLLPKFSTPVQKPVENAGDLRLGTELSHDLLHISKAKVLRSRFEAILGVPHQLAARPTERG